jgi:predicted HTH domain antitoxin
MVHRDMQFREVTISYPAGLEDSVQTTLQELEEQIRLMAALKMFELGKLSSGKAAELAGQTRPQFLETCSRYKVSVFNYPPDLIPSEIGRDLQTALGLLER